MKDWHQEYEVKNWVHHRYGSLRRMWTLFTAILFGTWGPVIVGSVLSGEVKPEALAFLTVPVLLICVVFFKDAGWPNNWWTGFTDTIVKVPREHATREEWALGWSWVLSDDVVEWLENECKHSHQVLRGGVQFYSKDDAMRFKLAWA